METLQTDVGGSPTIPADMAVADSSTAAQETSGESQASVTGTEEQKTEQQAQAVDPLADLPTLEELKQQAEQKLPGAQGMLNLRTAYEAQKAEFEPLKALEPWKALTEHYEKPEDVLADRELLSKIHSPKVDPVTQQPIPDQYTTLPFLEDLETKSPGVTDVIFTELLTLQVPDGKGGRDTLVRQLYRSHGLDPDRIDDYRNIDQRAPQTGFVTPDQLQGIDPKFHEAFKALSPAQREDVLAMKDVNTGAYPAHALDYLNDKMEALEARAFREQQQQREQQAQQAQQAQFEHETEQAVQTDISTLTTEMYDSIHQGLARVTFSSDPVIDAVERVKVMGTVAALIDPEVRKMGRIEDALAKAGTPLDPKFDELVQALAGGREAYVRHTRVGDTMRAKTALAQANLAKNQLLVKIGSYAKSLAKPSAENRAAQSQGLVNSLNGATARVIPQGAVAASAPNGNGNPYDANPYALGTPEYKQWNRQMDSQMGVTKAGTFS